MVLHYITVTTEENKRHALYKRVHGEDMSTGEKKERYINKKGVV